MSELFFKARPEVNKLACLKHKKPVFASIVYSPKCAQVKVKGHGGKGIGAGPVLPSIFRRGWQTFPTISITTSPNILIC